MRFEDLESRQLLDADGLRAAIASPLAAVVRQAATSSSDTTDGDSDSEAGNDAEAMTQYSSLLNALGSTSATSSTYTTVPTNGDTLPSGVAVVPRGFLVANNADQAGTVGAGSTIVRINRDGSQTPLFTGQSGLGLSALGVLSKGFVFAASNPTSGGNGSVLVIDRFGRQVADLSNSQWINQPTAIAVHDMGHNAQVFIANSGDGTITRLDVTIHHGRPQITSATKVATGFTTGTGTSGTPATITGLAYNASQDVLYVASAGDQGVFAISGAGQRSQATAKGSALIQNDANISNIVGVAVTPGGALLVSGNSADGTSSVVAEYTTTGTFVDTLTIATSPGAAAGLALKANEGGAVLGVLGGTTNQIAVRRVFFQNV